MKEEKVKEQEVMEMRTGRKNEKKTIPISNEKVSEREERKTERVNEGNQKS